MSKHRRERRAVPAGAAVPASAEKEAVVAQLPARTGWRRLPIWVWALIFVVPLVLSELMFDAAGRTANMVLFPIVWVGFWAAIYFRIRGRSGR